MGTPYILTLRRGCNDVQVLQLKYPPSHLLYLVLGCTKSGHEVTDCCDAKGQAILTSEVGWKTDYIAGLVVGHSGIGAAQEARARELSRRGTDGKIVQDSSPGQWPRLFLWGAFFISLVACSLCGVTTLNPIIGIPRVA